MEWINVTEEFTERQRHYNNKYLEIDEVYDELLEVSLFSSEEESYEIYVSYGIMYGIVYVEKEKAYELREEIKSVLEKEYQEHKEPTSQFINTFCKKYEMCIPNDIFFNGDALFDTLFNL